MAMNLNAFFDQFISPAQNQQGQPGQSAGNTSGGGVADLIGNLTQSASGSGWTDGKAGGFAGGVATGGLLGVLLGNKKMRKKIGKLGGGVVGYGGSAVLGALAMNAYQKWQAGQQAAPVTQAPQQAALPSPEAFDPALTQSAAGKPMQMVLIEAMIGAANADGHIDGDEQRTVFDAVERMDLASDEKAMVFDTLRNPPGPRDIAAQAKGLEQASEIYLASRLAIDPDEPSERAYLSALAGAMNLPDDLAKQLDAQVEGAKS
ncbi:MAG: tellurite resistance TerB family protein [Pseudomonadota bacterium]